MRGRVYATLVVFLAAMVVIATGPVAGAHTAVASLHTTDTDFSNATTFENLAIQGTGSSASAVTDSAWGFESGFETPSEWDVTDNVGGSSGITTETARTGSYSLTANGSTDGNDLYATKSASESKFTNITYYYHPGSGNYWNSGGIFREQSPGGDAVAVYLDITAGSGELIIAERTGGTWSTLDTTAVSESLTADAWNTLTIRLRNGSSGAYGEAVVNGNTYTTAEVTTSVTNAGATGVGQISPSNTGSKNHWDDVTTGATTEPATYISQNHSVNNPVDGVADISLTDAEAHVTWQGYDGNSWVDVASATYTTGGEKSLSLSGDYQAWRVNVTFVATGGSPDAALADEGMAVRTSAPALDNASASPQGGTKVTSTPTYSIDGSDPDFGDMEGDSLTLEWYRNGTLLDTTTETANGTWTFTPSSGRAGTSQWHVEVTDEYGHTVTSQDFVYEAPGELAIYNESAPTQLVDNATVELRYYYYEESADEPALVETRSTTDGTINMAGLPSDRPFIVVADGEGFISRRIYVESLFETQRIYLLPDSEQTVTTTFELVDYSGEYPSEDTVLLIERALNDSWQTVHGDRFGATGEFPATLRYNKRHRLVLLNTETGDRRVVGHITPLQDSTQTITVRSSGEADIQTGVQVSIGPSIRRLPETSDQQVNATVFSRTGDLQSWSIDVVYENATTGQNTTLASTSGTDPNGTTFAPTVNLTDRGGGTVYVTVDYTLDDGTSDSRTVTFLVTQLYENEYGLLPVLGSINTRLPSEHAGTVTALLSVMGSLLIMGAVASLPGASTEFVGVAGVIALAGFAVIGWVGYGPVIAGAGSWVAIAALRRGI